MRIPLSEFELPGDPGIEGDVTYSAIELDINNDLSKESDAELAYFVCGWREKDGAGVLVHGTKKSKGTILSWRSPRLLAAPSDPDQGLTVIKTEFHGVESLIKPYIRLVGCVETAEKPGVKQGFMYEGWHDGSGDWYPISIPNSEETVVKASKDEILVCCDEQSLDTVHVYSLEKQSWKKIQSGYADEWTIDEVFPAGDMYIIRLLHSDGRRSDLSCSFK